MNLFSLKDKVIIVTGATGILGSTFVNAIVEAGGSVVISGLNEALTHQRAQEINTNGGLALGVYANVLEEDSLHAAKEKILARFGKIDGLVNAAGGNVPESVVAKDQDIFDMNIPGLQKALILNLWGTIIPSQVFGAEMAKKWAREHCEYFFREPEKCIIYGAWLQPGQGSLRSIYKMVCS